VKRRECTRLSEHSGEPEAQAGGPEPPSAVRLSEIAYLELSFQAVYALRQGNVLAAEAPREPGELANTARRRVAQSKFLVSLLIVLLVGGSMLTLTNIVERFFLVATAANPIPVPVPLYTGTVIAGLLLLELSFLWMVGLQSLPTFLGSQILPVLETLPISEKKLDRVAFLVMLRLFDAPALTALVLTPLALGIATGSALVGLLVIPGVIVVIVLAMGLSLRTGRFFVQHVQGSRGGIRASVLRWFYLLLWAVPAFGIYGFVSFGFQIMYGLAFLGRTAPAALGSLLLVFPFPFGVLPLFGLSGPSSISLLPAGNAVTIALAALGYAGLTLGVAWWMLKAPRALSRMSPDVQLTDERKGAQLRPVGAPAAILLKDLRTASRTPGYAFVILLPLIDAVVIGLSSYIGAPAPGSVFKLAAAAVSTTAILATFFGPAFFATEVMGYSYTRTLPLTNRSMLFGKSSLIVLIYIVASVIVVGLTVLRLLNVWLFFAFIIAELPGLLAAAFLEIGLLFRRAQEAGVPVSLMSSGAWWATTVVVPGIAIAGLPILLFFVLQYAGVSSFQSFIAMGGVALAELGIFSLFALGLPGRGRG
jgi:predicted permease